MLYQIKSSKSMDEIERGLQESAARHQFGVIAVHDLKDTLKNKGVDLAMECRIFEVCNPHQAKKVLDADGAVSTALPCRISVFGSAKEYTLATMRPTVMMKAFANPQNRACGTGAGRSDPTDDERCRGLMRWNPQRRQSRFAPQDSHFGQAPRLPRG